MCVLFPYKCTSCRDGCIPYRPYIHTSNIFSGTKGSGKWKEGGKLKRPHWFPLKFSSLFPSPMLKNPSLHSVTVWGYELTFALLLSSLFTEVLFLCGRYAGFHQIFHFFRQRDRLGDWREKRELIRLFALSTTPILSGSKESVRSNDKGALTWGRPTVGDFLAFVNSSIIYSSSVI